MRPKRHETEFHCELCDIYTTSKETLETHFQGHKHKSALKRQKEEERLKSKLQSEEGHYRYVGIIETDAGFFCELCQCACTSISNVKTHISGRQHQQHIHFMENGNRKLTKIEKRLKNISPVIGLDFIIEYFNKRAPELSRFYNCILCDLKFQEHDIVEHILGAQHRLLFLKEFNEREFLVLKNLNLSKEDLIIHVEAWAEELERKHGRGTPNLRAMRPVQKTEPMDIVDITDNDNGEATPLLVPMETPNIKTEPTDEEEQPQQKKIKLENECSPSEVKIIDSFMVNSPEEKEAALAMARFLLGKLASFEIKNTPAKIKRAFGRSLFNQLRERAKSNQKSMKAAYQSIPGPSGLQQQKPPNIDDLLSILATAQQDPPPPPPSTPTEIPKKIETLVTQGYGWSPFNQQNQKIGTSPQEHPGIQNANPPSRHQDPPPPPPLPPSPPPPPPPPPESPKKIETRVTNQQANRPIPSQSMPQYQFPPQQVPWQKFVPPPPSFWQQPIPWSMMGTFPPPS